LEFVCLLYYISETDKDDKCLKEDKDLNFMRDTQYCDDEILASSVEEKEEVLQPHESPEPEKVMKKGKYNLRKSLAWDNEFFTSAGKFISNEVPRFVCITLLLLRYIVKHQVFWNRKNCPA